MRRTILLLVISIATLSASAQETRYITDILQLGLYQARDQSGEPIRNLVSGTEVVVLERIPSYARVRTAAGEEGWVKSGFLVADKPAQLRIAEVEADRMRLERELEAARAARAADVADAEALVADAADTLAAAEAERESLAELQQENDALVEQIDRYRGSVPWLWVVGVLIVALGAGFLSGYWWLDASIRRRHGGFRVH